VTTPNTDIVHEDNKNVEMHTDSGCHSAGTPKVMHNTVKIGNLDIFYREAGPKDAPVVLLLHGFPSSSHMFRDLIPALADKYHVVAPDYPGFGLSTMPDPKDYAYTFDNLAKTVADFTDAIGLKEHVLYVQDYGGPIGFRLATSRPERVQGIVVQNGNMYLEGLSENLAPLSAYMTNPTQETEAPVRGMLAAGTTKFQWTHGTRNPAVIDPAFWVYDQAFLDRPGNDAIQLALFRDYKTNPPLFPVWQEYLRTHRPPVLITWGKNDPFFTAAGADAFLRDVPDAELHLLDTGHFALADHASEIAQLMKGFLRRNTV
jgi:pimeloyl-ACP methyl ester carboxylesterase